MCVYMDYLCVYMDGWMDVKIYYLHPIVYYILTNIALYACFIYII